MLTITKALATCAFLFFGGALLTAAADPIVTCRLQYRYDEGFNADARCVGDCPSSNCALLVSFEGDAIVYTCLCADGQTSWCPGALVQDDEGIAPTCLNLYEPCGWHMEYQCWAYLNVSNEYANACNCEETAPWQ